MSCAQVFELCKVCKKPSKMRIDFLGKINIVDVVCDCQNKEREKVGQKRFKASSRTVRRDYY